MEGFTMIFFAILAQVLLIFNSEAQKFSLRGSGCPKTRVVPNLDLPRYLGKWYEIESYPNLFQNGICTEANYGPVNARGQVQVINKELNKNGQVSAVRGHATKERASGDLTVNLHVPFTGEQSSDYDVLGTDYNNWSVVHACREFGPVKFEFAWILCRQRSLTPEQWAQISRVLQFNNLDVQSFKVTQQQNCPNLDNLPFKFIA